MHILALTCMAKTKIALFVKKEDLLTFAAGESLYILHHECQVFTWENCKAENLQSLRDKDK